MKEHHFWSKKPDTMLDWVCLLFSAIGFYLFLSNLGFFAGVLQALLKILSPFAGGIVLAFVLNPLVKFFHRAFFNGRANLRWVCILLAYVVAVLLVILLGSLVMPQIIASVSMLFNNFPGYVQSLQDTLLLLEEDYGIDLQQAMRFLDVSETVMKEVYPMVTGIVPQVLSTLGNFASNFVAVFTAVASSVYMLSSKDKLLHQLRTLTYAFLPRPVAQNTLRVCHFANENFTGFFVGKIIDSAIIGVLTFALMSLLRLDFALLVSVFVGITNIIPVFGPFIGAIPSIFILLLVDPVQALIFAVLILFIQQLDGNFIGPKILGQSIGISSLWVLFAIVVGGDLFGLVGMVLGVPLFATLFGLLQEIVHFLLDRKGIDGEGNPLPGKAPETAETTEPAEEAAPVS